MAISTLVFEQRPEHDGLANTTEKLVITQSCKILVNCLPISFTMIPFDKTFFIPKFTNPNIQMYDINEVFVLRCLSFLVLEY